MLHGREQTSFATSPPNGSGCVHLVLGVWFLERGLFNEDEGWYLYAARQVDAGLMPVRDFVFFQGLVYPRVMAGLLDAGQGMIIAARWLSWLMLVLAVGVTTIAGVRIAGQRGGLLALGVMAIQPLLVATAVLAKPYALCLLFWGANAAALGRGLTPRLPGFRAVGRQRWRTPHPGRTSDCVALGSPSASQSSCTRRDRDGARARILTLGQCAHGCALRSTGGCSCGDSADHD